MSESWDGILAERLLEWMGKHDMSTKTFAQLAGLDDSTVYGITSRKRGARTGTLVKICKAHGLSADWLLGLEER